MLEEIEVETSVSIETDDEEDEESEKEEEEDDEDLYIEVPEYKSIFPTKTRERSFLEHATPDYIRIQAKRRSMIRMYQEYIETKKDEDEDEDKDGEEKEKEDPYIVVPEYKSIFPTKTLERPFLEHATQDYIRIQAKRCSMIRMHQGNENPILLMKDHKLDPFFIWDDEKSITKEILPFVVQLQKRSHGFPPIQVNSKTGHLSNGKELMHFILNDPRRRYLFLINTHHHQESIHVFEKNIDPSLRIFYCRKFKYQKHSLYSSDGVTSYRKPPPSEEGIIEYEEHWVWVTKLLGFPHGWVFIERDLQNGKICSSNESEILEYLSHCTPILL